MKLPRIFHTWQRPLLAQYALAAVLSSLALILLMEADCRMLLPSRLYVHDGYGTWSDAWGLFGNWVLIVLVVVALVVAVMQAIRAWSACRHQWKQAAVAGVLTTSKSRNALLLQLLLEATLFFPLLVPFATLWFGRRAQIITLLQGGETTTPWYVLLAFGLFVFAAMMLRRVVAGWLTSLYFRRVRK